MTRRRRKKNKKQFSSFPRNRSMGVRHSHVTDEDISKSTPEYIHPRNCGRLQWLMSPPVIEQNGNVLQSLPTEQEVLFLRKPILLRPDDILSGQKQTADKILHQSVSQSSSQCCGFDNVTNSLSSILERTVKTRSTVNQALSNRSDSGFSTPDSQTKADSEVLDKLYLLCKECSDVSEFNCKLKLMMSHEACDSLLSFLVSTPLCKNSPHECHLCLLMKLLSTPDLNSSSVKSPATRQFPIAVFWDIENCQVPTGKSALDIVKKIRMQFFSDHYETEFMAVCDINKETRQVVQDLNDAQVNVIHVNAFAKNTADDKLRQSIRRYAQSHQAPATVILITGDCNFTSEVSDLHHRHKFFVVLLHNDNTSDALKQAAHTTVLYEEFVNDLPIVYPYLPNDVPLKYHLHISNLPCNEDIIGIRRVLKQLSANCGGKVLNLIPPFATIRFSAPEQANRALKRLNGEFVFGSKILVEQSKRVCIEQRITSQKKAITKNYSKNSLKQPDRNEERLLVEKAEKGSGSVQANQSVSICVSNVDAQLGVEEIRKSISKLVSQFCEVLHLHIHPHNRFTVVCEVLVPHGRGALDVLAHLHRKRLGSKRILAMVSPSTQFSLHLFRNEIVPLLKLDDDCCCPFYQLATLYNNRYHKILKVSHLQSLSDIVTLEDTRNGLMVHLKLDCAKKIQFVCPHHHKLDRPRRNEVLVHVSLRELSSHLHMLLHSHNGLIYLNSLEQCYEAEFGPFPHAKGPDEGVLLEHELSYVPGVVVTQGMVKVITWMQVGHEPGEDLSPTPRSMTSKLVNFAKELVNFLKIYPKSCISLDDFKAAYSKHFGDCWPLDDVDDVLDRLLLIPHVVQVISNDDSQLVVLAHRAQVKRFTQEIIKILKFQPDKTLSLSSLPDAYLRMFDRPWNLHDYGVNTLNDLLDDIPDGSICVTDDVVTDTVMSLPSRERSQEEVASTALFSSELVEILKCRPQYRLSFKDFIPAYHRQFGRQCKLAKFGFTKLLDLFESLPLVVQVVENSREKYLQLSREEKLKALSSQIVGLLGDREDAGVPLHRVQSMFTRRYGRPLIPLQYGCQDVEELVKKLPHVVQLLQCDDGSLVIKQSERRPLRLLATQLLVLLFDIEAPHLILDRMHQAYIDRYKEEIKPLQYGFTSLAGLVGKSLAGMAKVECSGLHCTIELKPIYRRAKRVRNIVLRHGGTMTLGEFNRSYREQYKEALDAERFGFRSCEDMLRAVPQVVAVKGFGIKKTLVLRNHMHYGPLSCSVTTSTEPTRPPALHKTPSAPTVLEVESALLSRSVDDVIRPFNSSLASLFSAGFPPTLEPPDIQVSSSDSVLCKAGLDLTSCSNLPHDLYASYKRYRQLQEATRTNSQVACNYPCTGATGCPAL